MEKFANIYTVPGEFTPYSLRAVLKSVLTRKPISIQHRMNREKIAGIITQVTDKPDIILLEGLHTAAFIEDIRKRFPKIPLVLRQANVEYLLLKRNAAVTKNPFIKLFLYDQFRLMKKFELSAMQHVDAVTAITEFDKDVFLSHLPELNCFVSPAGTEIPKNLDLPRKEDTLLAISNWKWKPNYDGLKWFLDKVWPDLIQQKPQLKFDIAGDGLDEKFRSKYSSKNIRFLGFVEDLEELRQTSTIFIAPLLSGSGMKLKIVESLASGLPIVTSRFGVEGTLLKDEIHFLEADTASEFKQTILLLLDNDQKREQLSRKAVEIAREKYTWSSVTENLISFLESQIRN